MASNAAIEPADGTVHSFAHACFIGRGGGDHIVKLHDDVGANGVLEGNGVLGCEEPGSSQICAWAMAVRRKGEVEEGDLHRGAVVRGEEFDAFFGDFC